MKYIFSIIVYYFFCNISDKYTIMFRTKVKKFINPEQKKAKTISENRKKNSLKK